MIYLGKKGAIQKMKGLRKDLLEWQENSQHMGFWNHNLSLFSTVKYLPSSTGSPFHPSSLRFQIQ